MQTLLVGIALVSVISSLATLISISGDLAGRPVVTWSRSGRAVSGVVLLIVGAAAGIGAHQSREADPAAELPKPGQQSAMREGVGDSRRSENANGLVEEADINSVPGREHRAQVGGALQETRASILTETGEPVFVLEAIAARSSCIVQGTLAEVTKEEEDLGGLLTTNLVLRVRTESLDHGRDAFELTSRGGGFDAETAKRQAVERLSAIFRNRLEQAACLRE